jgi:AraC family transcriptional regulator of adaptative response/methylated-DNA-[protein]-cysteine methyltransferase
MITQSAANFRQVELVQRTCRYIEDNLEGDLTLTALGAELSLSPGHVQRTFKQILGISPRQYADARRLERLKQGLKKDQTVTGALYEAGYGSSSRLYERSAQQLGMTPATYKRGGRGMHLRFAIAGCPLGRLLLAGTDRGVSAVYLGDEDEQLEEALRAEYPAARIEKEEGPLQPWVDELLQHLAGRRHRLDLPLDVQATAFQWRVWQELCKVPYGTTRTYSDIARTLGQPTANRAVARACATNPVSLVIPCHRIVREDGGLGGYRWGLDRKEKLLEQERARATAKETGG